MNPALSSNVERVFASALEVLFPRRVAMQSDLATHTVLAVNCDTNIRCGASLGETSSYNVHFVF